MVCLSETSYTITASGLNQLKKISILQVAYVIAMASKKSYLYLTYSTRNECAGYREFFVLICQPSKRQRTDCLLGLPEPFCTF